MGFPWLLERQPFGELPVFPGGVGRAAQDTWIPLLPASSSLCEEGWRNSRIWWLSPASEHRRLHKMNVRGLQFGEAELGGVGASDRRTKRRKEQRRGGKILFSPNSVCIPGPVPPQLGHRLWLCLLKCHHTGLAGKGQASIWSEGSAPPHPWLFSSLFCIPSSVYQGLPTPSPSVSGIPRLCNLAYSAPS